MVRNRFYRTSQHGGVGSSVMFWRVDGAGYTSNIDEAHIYTLEEAQQQVDSGHFCNNEHPLSADHVDALAEWRVDHQYVKSEWSNLEDDNDEYVLIKEGEWDGNDVPFMLGMYSTNNYSHAEVFTLEQAENIVSVINCRITRYPKSKIDEVARRTFQFKNLNRRKMISGAGVIGCLKERESTATGKTRWNCPGCGKISWQWNPYDFDGCKDFECDEYNSLV